MVTKIIMTVRTKIAIGQLILALSAEPAAISVTVTLEAPDASAAASTPSTWAMSAIFLAAGSLAIRASERIFMASGIFFAAIAALSASVWALSRSIAELAVLRSG